MNKYVVYRNDEIFQSDLTLLQATRLVAKLQKLFPTCLIQWGKQKV